ncbi:phosphonate metabolism protein/1,5-bisphosphokinase (PRPP-forming) PhnN [Paraburkholderia tropica]|uniref:phosphonate metabolism protein/1,5-bisphosphokinase (PRPP-forming) PhnN n=1 Tax=Paraburkholderia tropica TaxID=92647 RepID=UPI002AB1E0CC|nr:phosphonate metabolism protein/1,5-bisphosphokinase (PRPP-forming) PhnN [Paraburkholderia tropica]
MNNPGVFFFVVGPSGAGKDTLIDAARAALPDARFVYATRYITRPSGAPGENHIGITESEFAAAEAAGKFVITWDAHDLRYGLPIELKEAVEAGHHVIANGSRAIIASLIGKVPNLVVVEVTAPVNVLAKRIAGRGRETEAQIAARLARTVSAAPDGVRTIRVMNDSTPEIGARRFIATIEAIAGEPPQAAQRPGWDDFLEKQAGITLDEPAYSRIIDSVAAQRFSQEQCEQILRCLIEDLQDDEVGALARVRTARMPRIDWNEPIVVDKHSMGGVPGSRITLIVAPIVAAFGLLMPKTSSRAITSASGTADAMETIARVDLDAAELRRVAIAARACIAWNGRLNHSNVDDVTNAMVRPLKLDTRRWSVASILSKKYSAGATHVVVDLPFGPQAKLATEPEALELGQLFERIGAELGMVVKAFVTDGSAPVGRGIGPALEMRDVLRVLNDDASAPRDLREKALMFAGAILAWSPQVGSLAQGRSEAERLLRSGAARAAFERIVDAQGRRELVLPSALTEVVRAPVAGVVTGFDGWALGGIARAAGAPGEKGAGVDLLCTLGERVEAGEPLLRIHAAGEGELRTALDMARASPAVSLETRAASCTGS